MEIAILVLGCAVLALMAFTLGAAVAWRLEGRRPLVAPPWLHVLNGLSFLAMTLFVVVALPPPSRVVIIDPLWWNGLKAVMLVLSVLAIALSVREAFRARRA